MNHPLTSRHLVFKCVNKNVFPSKKLPFPSKPRCKYWTASHPDFHSLPNSPAFNQKKKALLCISTPGAKCSAYYCCFSIGCVTSHYITLAHVHILNHVQLAEHWGGILCKFLITILHDWIHSGNRLLCSCLLASTLTLLKLYNKFTAAGQSCSAFQSDDEK